MPRPRGEWIELHKGAERRRQYDVSPGPLGWLIELLDDAGPVRLEAGMSGVLVVGLEWREIHYWIEASGQHDISPGVRRDVMRLSAVYAKAITAAQKMDCEVPVDPDG